MFVVGGESLIDLISKPVRADGTLELLAKAGGSPMNCAIALAKLGASSGFLCPISTDTFGDTILKPLKAAGVNPVPPVTGNDATIAALQLIISGDQYNTISKPSEIVAAAAANVAVKFLKGETPEAKTTLYETPSELFVPAVVTSENIKAEIFDKGINKPEEICTGEYAEGCKKLGIMQ